jgi:hypothetical protein
LAAGITDDIPPSAPSPPTTGSTAGSAAPAGSAPSQPIGSPPASKSAGVATKKTPGNGLASFDPAEVAKLDKAIANDISTLAAATRDASAFLRAHGDPSNYSIGTGLEFEIRLDKKEEILSQLGKDIMSDVLIRAGERKVPRIKRAAADIISRFAKNGVERLIKQDVNKAVGMIFDEIVRDDVKDLNATGRGRRQLYDDFTEALSTHRSDKDWNEQKARKLGESVGADSDIVDAAISDLKNERNLSQGNKAKDLLNRTSKFGSAGDPLLALDDDYPLPSEPDFKKLTDAIRNNKIYQNRIKECAERYLGYEDTDGQLILLSPKDAMAALSEVLGKVKSAHVRKDLIDVVEQFAKNKQITLSADDINELQTYAGVASPRDFWLRQYRPYTQ